MGKKTLYRIFVTCLDGIHENRASVLTSRNIGICSVIQQEINHLLIVTASTGSRGQDGVSCIIHGIYRGAALNQHSCLSRSIVLHGNKKSCSAGSVLRLKIRFSLHKSLQYLRSLYIKRTADNGSE